MKTVEEIVEEKFYIARCATDGYVDYKEAAIAAVKEALKQSCGVCSNCGKNHAEICGGCVSDISQNTAEQAINSIR